MEDEATTSFEFKPIPYEKLNEFFFDKSPLLNFDFSLLTVGELVIKPVEIEKTANNDYNLYTMSKLNNGYLFKEKQLDCSVCCGYISYVDDKHILIKFENDKTKLYLFETTSFELRNIYPITSYDISLLCN